MHRGWLFYRWCWYTPCWKIGRKVFDVNCVSDNILLFKLLVGQTIILSFLCMLHSQCLIRVLSAFYSDMQHSWNPSPWTHPFLKGELSFWNFAKKGGLNFSHQKGGVGKIGGDLVPKRMTLLHFFTSSFQNVIFCEILWLSSRKKITRQK